MDRHNGKSPDGRAAGSATGESCEFSYYAHPLTGHPLSVSSAVEKMFGFTPEEWREEEKLWERIVHPDDRIRVLKEFEEARTRIKDTCFIYRILTRDRAVRWVEDHITWEKDQDGNPVQIRGRMYDIIHRRGEDVKKEREHALLRAVNRLFIETFTSKTDEDVAQSALAAAKELTGSRSGFVAKLDDGRFFVVATSGEEWKVAETPHPLRDVMEERLKSLGIWERILTEKTPLIINQFVLHFHLEMPQGHPPVTSLLAVPLTGEEEVYGMIVLADKEDGYDLWDQEAVESFAAILTETLMRKEIERELTIKEKTIESSMNGIVLADAKGVITYANPSFITMWGFEKTEGVIGKAVLDFWKNKRQAQKAMEETINKGMYVGELKGKRKDGSEFEAQFSTRVIEDENDNILCIMGVFEDITHRKQTELTRRKLLHGLRERIKELRCLYTIGEMTREKDTSIEELLERVVRIMPKAFRYPSAAVVRIVLEDLTYETPGFREAKWVLKKPMVINGKQEGWVEVRYVKEEPLCNGTPFLEEEDLVVRSVANRVASFLERKRSEERVKTYYTQLEKEVEERTRELREAQEELVRKEKLAVMGQLAGSVGHELRNPLSVIGNSAYFLKMKLDPADGMTRKHLDIIEENILKTNNIISGLLGFSRTGTPLLTKTDLNEDIVTVLSGLEIPETIAVETVLDETLPAVSVDVDQMQRAILNLVLNAIQSMPGRGTLKIHTAREKEGIRISIQDTGRGIPEEDLDKIFEPLFTTKPKGIGLGLVIVKNIIEGHGGSLHVRSKVGKGTTFTILLPV